jgi:hypothetical protein
MYTAYITWPKTYYSEKFKKQKCENHIQRKKDAKIISVASRSGQGYGLSVGESYLSKSHGDIVSFTQFQDTGFILNGVKWSDEAKQGYDLQESTFGKSYMPILSILFTSYFAVGGTRKKDLLLRPK